MKKSRDQFPDKIKDIFKLISFSNLDEKPQIMGSNAMHGMKYGADYDLYEIVYTSKKENQFKTFVYDHFKKICKLIKSKKNIYFIDFKCGEDKNKPIRWTPNEVLKNKEKFMNSLGDKSRIKIDIIAWVDNKFIEFSNIYSFRYTNGRLINEKSDDAENIQSSLIQDIKDYHKDDQFLKCLKRLYVLYNIQDKNTDKLVDLFNSNIGHMYRIKSDFSTMELLLTVNRSKETVVRIKSECDSLKNELSAIEAPKIVFQMIDKIQDTQKASTLSKRLNRIINVLNDKINKETKSWMKKHRISYLPLLNQ